MDAIHHEAARLMFFPDFSVDTQKWRKSFDAVKQSLCSRNYREESYSCSWCSIFWGSSKITHLKKKKNSPLTRTNVKERGLPD